MQSRAAAAVACPRLSEGWTSSDVKACESNGTGYHFAE